MRENTSRAAPSPALLDPRLHAVLANPLRYEIFMRTGARPWSPTELAKATGRSLKHVCKAIEELKRAGLVEPVGTESGPQGGRLHFYRAARLVVGADDWERMDRLAQASATGQIVAELQRDMADALEAETFCAHPQHALFRDHRRVDDEGMERCAEILTRAWEEIAEAEGESIQRSQSSGEPLIPIGIGLAAFPRAPEDTPE